MCVGGWLNPNVSYSHSLTHTNTHSHIHRHHPSCLLFAGKGSSTQPLGQRHAINYWSVHDNKLLRKFRGHADTVVSISVSPADDKFLTSSHDRTVRLWNLQEAGSMASLQLPASTIGTPRAVFDSTGLVFAVTASMAGNKGQYVHLYDARQYGVGGFAELTVAPEGIATAIAAQIGGSMAKDYTSTASWTSLAFNASGNQLLAGTVEGLAIILDGFEATVQRVVAPTAKLTTTTDSTTTQGSGAVCCFTSDDKTVLLGNLDGTISCYNVDTGTVVKSLTGHTGPITAMAANPKYAQFASACSTTALWSW